MRAGWLVGSLGLALGALLAGSVLARREHAVTPPPPPLAAPPPASPPAPGLAVLPRCLAVELRGPAEFSGADRGPNLRIRLRNVSERPLLVLRPLDGSNVGWRVVEYSWSVSRPDGVPVTRRTIGRCGNTNGIEEADFVPLDPGEGVDLESHTFAGQPGNHFDLSAPGRYEITLTYRFRRDRADPALNGSPLSGRAAPVVRDLLARADEGEVHSAPLIVTRLP